MNILVDFGKIVDNLRLLFEIKWEENILHIRTFALNSKHSKN